MKNLKHISMIAALLVIGCSDYLDVNVDPNNPADADERLVLPAAQQSIAARAGNYYRITGSIWSQHYTQNNTSSQYISTDNYDVDNLNFLENDFTEMFSGPLNDLKFVKRKSEASENWTNYLIAEVMEVYAFQLIADLYDGAPLAEGLNGDEDNFTPDWNTGPEVYDMLLARLDDALSRDFSSSTNVSPGTSDLVFGGDVDSWIRFANTLKLKLMIRYSAADPGKAKSLISALVNSGVEFLDVSASISTYYDQPDRGNPLYEADRRNQNTTTNLKASLTMVNYLELANDPRINAFYDAPIAGGPVKGMRQGTSSMPSTQLDSKTISGAKVLATDPVYFISLAESYFLRAEAAARAFSNEDAASLYAQGVLTAFNRYGFDGSSFLAGPYAYPNGTSEENVEAIIEQKWIAHLGGNSIEAWFDKLRTGYPSFSTSAPGEPGYDPLAPGAPIFTFPVDAVTFDGQFPRRLLIPDDEVLNNPNAPAQPANGILTPVWWDLN
ncbi:MAG: SusD/RagB family nutrient-binding outer membrane lipoprotein [Cyclobacteriaceae bacterium]|jgi:hypothetical protein|nr:SusD/RagB family nutrient-binding outer membrane lipoprotein [Cyclobacteriaceae bacterium]MDH4298687.1 SusD/RagB family nutrient-binding outer membrane lipoprotein [Cyclobacteriaceae bacterium]MDH5248196.1 SusD/RagB family nutrient-binding outer membrane lipoprotein [Cyclobacteriaceae bacterium]